MDRKKPYIISCIPAYNEEKTIASVVIKAMKHVDKVIVCDDGSKDMTAEIAEKLGAEVLRHERNSGYGAALASLFEKAREIEPDVMVTLDADGQHDPDDIPKLIEPLFKDEADVVIGSRFLESGEDIPRYRKIGIKVITKLAETGRGRITDAQSGFRAYNRKAFQAIKPTEEGMGASTEILIKAEENRLRIKEVPVKIKYDIEKPSTQNPLAHGLDVALSTVKHISIRRPLLFYGIPGFLSLLVGISFWVWTLQIFTTTRQVSTNIALVAIGATIVGLMLLTTATILWVLISVIREVK